MAGTQRIHNAGDLLYIAVYNVFLLSNCKAANGYYITRVESCHLLLETQYKSLKYARNLNLLYIINYNAVFRCQITTKLRYHG